MRCRAKHRIPLACIETIIETTKNSLPKGHCLPKLPDCSFSAPTFSRLPDFLTVDVCINDCMMYIDLPYVKVKSSEHTDCTCCREPRCSNNQTRRVCTKLRTLIVRFLNLFSIVFFYE